MQVQFHKNGYLGWGIASSVILALGLSALIVTPTPDSAHAETVDMSATVEEVLSLKIEKYDPSTSTYIPTNNLRMSISPGSFGMTSARITASTNSANGQTLSFRDTDGDNAMYDPAYYDRYSIPALSSSVTIADDTDSSSAFPANTWGYSLDSTPRNFGAVPTTDSVIDSTSEGSTEEYDFTVGARIGNLQANGSYSSEILFTLVANGSPSAPLFYRTRTMQEFTPEICASVKAPLATLTEVTDKNGYNYADNGTNATIVPSTTLVDQRDGQEYTVRKLADGNCWMTDNLRYGAVANDMNASPAIHKTNSGDLALSDHAYEGKMSNLEDETHFNNEEVRSGWLSYSDNLSYTSPYISTYQANMKDDNGTTYGSLYNYCAASGGTACTNKDIKPTSIVGSICPSNWTLPPYVDRSYDPASAITDGSAKDYGNLRNVYTLSSDATGISKITSAPLSFNFAGSHQGNSRNYVIGGSGYYWTNDPNQTYVRALYLNNGTYITIAHNYSYSQSYDLSVRCVLAN